MYPFYTLVKDFPDEEIADFIDASKRPYPVKQFGMCKEKRQVDEQM
jgi:hypothetical protein